MKNIVEAVEYLEAVNQVRLPSIMPKFSEFRALMNITMPYNLSLKFYEIQDKILKDELQKKGIVDVGALQPLRDFFILYQGDITTLKADAIVNAGNEKLLGCFQPLHTCIDNAIHSFAGLQVRRDLMKLMQEQGHDEENGKCKVTKGYNLPSKYIFHTVGPKINREVTEQNKEDLKNCYLSCLQQADELQLNSLVFCSIATGLYGFPIEQAASIAVSMVKEYLNQRKSHLQRVVFNVFSKRDYDVYYRNIQEAAV